MSIYGIDGQGVDGEGIDGQGGEGIRSARSEPSWAVAAGSGRR